MKILKRVLVTGGAGFIGSHLVERLIAQGHRVVCIDNFSRDLYPSDVKWKNIEPFCRRRNFTLIQGDLRNQSLLKDVFARYPFETVVHLAGVAGVRLSVEKPHLYDESNIWATINLIEECRKTPPERFILASSSSVYGNSYQIPCREDQPLHPISPYGASKAAAELFCQTYHNLYSMPLTILRFFTVYGPRQRPDMAIFKFTKAVDSGAPIQLFGDGESKRDYTYIDDILNGIESSMSNASIGSGTFNLGGGHAVALKDLIGLIESALGKKAIIEKVPPQKGDVDTTLADISLAQRVLGYTPRVSINKGISLFAQWYRSNYQVGESVNENTARALTASKTDR